MERRGTLNTPGLTSFKTTEARPGDRARDPNPTTNPNLNPSHRGVETSMRSKDHAVLML